MLVLTRKVGEVVEIQLADDTDPQTPIAELFSQGPIKCMVTHVSETQVKLGIAADRRFLILRDEIASGRKPEGKDVR